MNPTQVFDESSIATWQPATWQDYLNYRDNPDLQMISYHLFFNSNQLLITDMGGEGLNHSKFCALIELVLGLWSIQFSEQELTFCGHCLLEKPETRAASPDLVFYVGTEIPVWQQGETRSIDLNQWRVPDLVGEIADTTLSSDLDEKKQLYAALGIPEYWVVSVRGKQVLVFFLQEDGKYQESAQSQVFTGLEMNLLDQALVQMDQGQTTTQVARWFQQQIQKNTSEEIS
jgi:Uma2 family endonuclease